MAPPTGEAEGGGPVRQGLWVYTVGIWADVVVPSLQPMNPNRAPSWAQDTSVWNDKIKVLLSQWKKIIINSYESCYSWSQLQMQLELVHLDRDLVKKKIVSKNTHVRRKFFS